MSKPKRRNMQKRPFAPEVSVESIDSPQAQHMLAVIQSIIDTGTYPCPECGTLVAYVEYDPVFDGMHFRCPKPGCRYEGYWGI